MAKRDDLVKRDENSNVPIASGDISDFELGMVNIAELAADGFELERFVSLKEGQGFVGVLIGEGAPIRFTANDKVTDVRTWRFKPTNGLRGVTLRVLGAAQLNARLADAKPGDTVAAIRTGTTRSRAGNVVNTYDIAVKTADANVIDVPSTYPSK